MNLHEIIASVYKDCGKTQTNKNDRDTSFVSSIANSEITKIFAAQAETTTEVRNVG